MTSPIFKVTRLPDPKPLIIKVIRWHGTQGIVCPHQHRTFTSAQHCRRVQTREYPDGIIAKHHIDPTSYTLEVR